MFFKNLKVFRLMEPTDFSLIEEQLKECAFEPCHATQSTSYGWVSVLKDAELMTHSIGKNTMLCLKVENKVLPPAAIKEAVEKHCDDYKKQFDKEPSRKEKQQIKDDVIFGLMPNMPTVSKKIFAYLSGDYLVINTGNKNEAEFFCNALRQARGSLPVVPIDGKGLFNTVARTWIVQGTGRNEFKLNGDYELYNGLESINTVKFKCHEDTKEAIELINNNFFVSKISLSYGGKLSFSLDKDLSFKQLSFHGLQPDLSEDPDDNEIFDAEFALMTGELELFIADIIEIFCRADDKKPEEQTEIAGL